jgi:hypothetical protein
MIERSGDVVCDMHRARGDEEREFLGSASKSKLTVYQWFDLKTTVMVYQWFGLKTTGTVFSGLTLKSVATVSPGLTLKSVVCFLVEPQNQGGGEFPGLVLKTGSCGLMIWASKSPRRFLNLGIKTKWVMVCQLPLKIDGRMRRRRTRHELGFPSFGPVWPQNWQMCGVDSARGIIIEVAWK